MYAKIRGMSSVMCGLEEFRSIQFFDITKIHLCVRQYEFAIANAYSNRFFTANDR